MKARYALAAIVVAAVVLVIGYVSLTSSRYITVDDLARLDRRATVIVEGRVENIVIDEAKDEIVFVLIGEKTGFKVNAIYPLYRFKAEYGGLPEMGKNVEPKVVMEGVYDPASRTLQVTRIIEGCHKAYEEPPAWTS